MHIVTNYNYKLRLGYFSVSTKKGDLVKDLVLFPKIFWGWGGGEGGHKSTENHKNFAYVMLNWIHFTSDYCMVDDG